MRHSCKSDSQTLAETLPSFLGWRKLCSLICFFLSLRLQNPGIKKRPFPLSSPSKQHHGSFFSEAFSEHQIRPSLSYHCNYAFHCPDTKDDRMCGIGPGFHYVSASFRINGLR
ncbi:Hypothetical predicted protein [Xyrichtys novacula]|uniref:Uncharacterized protein n=1 Tax=Xyrichtys novacula TaxID=13765 RepID=A0AAV1HL09_XYRNO|nr:Hypothetical predicted protein [Xyrichtys novacula]